MITATWFRKAKTPEAAPAKDSSPAVEPIVPAAADVSATTPAKDEVSKVETVAASSLEKDAPALGGTLRASRLVEAGRKGSTDLKSRLSTLLAKAEPWGKPAGAAVALVVVGALGYAGGYASSGRSSSEELAILRWSEASDGIRENREDVARLAAEMKSVRTALDGLRSERRAGDPAKQAQLIERSSSEASAKMAKLADQLDRIEKTQRDPARIGSIVERLDRIEKQVQTASAPPAAAPKPVAAAAPAEVATTGSLPAVDARPPARPAEPVDPRKLPADGYALRDIEDGFALVEGRNGRFFEVSPGMNLPGLGRVEAIERRGRQWVVVTPKGYIGER